MIKNLLIATSLSFSIICSAQTKTNTKGSEYQFTIVKNLDATDVQNQNQTSTCWSFSSLSFF